MLHRGDTPVKVSVSVSAVCSKCVAVCYKYDAMSYKCVALCNKCVAVLLLLNLILLSYARQARCVCECRMLQCVAVPLLRQKMG